MLSAISFGESSINGGILRESLFNFPVETKINQMLFIDHIQSDAVSEEANKRFPSNRNSLLQSVGYGL